MAVQVGERRILPVIGVRVRQEHGVDGGPRQAGDGQAGAELSRPQTHVDEHAETVRLHQTGIATAPTGEHRETQTDLSLAKGSSRSFHP